MYATVDRTKAKYKKKPKANVEGKGAMGVAIVQRQIEQSILWMWEQSL